MTRFPHRGGILLALALTSPGVVSAQLVIQPVGISLSGADQFYPASRLIDGSGLEFALPSGTLLPTLSNLRWANPAADSWVTAAPGGFPSDWYAHSATIPTFVLDLGLDRTLDTVHLWAFSGITGVNDTYSGNSARTLEFRFNTAAQGNQVFAGPLITVTADHGLLNQTPAGYVLPRQDFALGSQTARWIEMRITDNWYVAPGNGTTSDGHGHLIRGGDRVGLGEIRFSQIPEPVHGIALTAAGLLAFALARRSRDSRTPALPG